MSTNNIEQKPKQRVIVSQSDFPQLSIKKSLRIIHAIWEQFAGHPTAPHNIALALGMSPTSGTWRNLTGTSMAYGLTKGGYAAKMIELSPLGKRIVAPTSSEDEHVALREAVLKPRIMKMFYEKYDRAKFPDSKIAENVLIEMGLPKERAKSAVEILHENGIYTGILRETQSGYFVAIEEIPVSSEKKEMAQEDLAKKEVAGETSLSQPREKTKISFGEGLYVNFEIHISADTPVETVEAIFKNMRKYLMENE